MLLARHEDGDIFLHQLILYEAGKRVSVLGQALKRGLAVGGPRYEYAEMVVLVGGHIHARVAGPRLGELAEGHPLLIVRAVDVD